MRKALLAGFMALAVLLASAIPAMASPPDKRPQVSDPGTTQAGAAGPKPVPLLTAYSPGEKSGTWTFTRKVDPKNIQPDGIGAWWGGYYYESVTNTFQASNVREDPWQAFLTLGRGSCEESMRKTEISGTISFGGDVGPFRQLVNLSFGFEATGTKTFQVTNRYCGPAAGETGQYRTFYKTLDYNQFQTSAVRIYYTWSGNFDHIDSRLTTTYVPHMAVYTADH